MVNTFYALAYLSVPTSVSVYRAAAEYLRRKKIHQITRVNYIKSEHFVRILIGVIRTVTLFAPSTGTI